MFAIFQTVSRISNNQLSVWTIAQCVCVCVHVCVCVRLLVFSVSVWVCLCGTNLLEWSECPLFKSGARTVSEHAGEFARQIGKLISLSLSLCAPWANDTHTRTHAQHTPHTQWHSPTPRTHRNTQTHTHTHTHKSWHTPRQTPAVLLAPRQTRHKPIWSQNRVTNFSKLRRCLFLTSRRSFNPLVPDAHYSERQDNPFSWQIQRLEVDLKLNCGFLYFSPWELMG